MNSKVLKKEDKIDKYFQLAVKKMLVMNYSPRKMKDFLIKKGASKAEADIVISKLTRYSIIDEEEFVKDVISYCDAKHYGYNKIIQMLKQRQISDKYIASVIINHERENKEAQIQCNILQKRYKNKNNANLKKSIYSALIRYGFEENVASLYASRVFNSTKIELNVLKLDYQKLFLKWSKKLKGNELKQKLIKSLLCKGYRISDINLVIGE